MEKKGEQETYHPCSTGQLLVSDGIEGEKNNPKDKKPPGSDGVQAVDEKLAVSKAS